MKVKDDIVKDFYLFKRLGPTLFSAIGKEGRQELVEKVNENHLISELKK